MRRGGAAFCGAGTGGAPGGYQIWRWTGIDWALAPGGAWNLSVGPAGKPWIATSAGQISRWL